MIAVYNAEDLFLTINGTELKDSDDLCECGEESDYGCHGVREGSAYSEYYCRECYLKHGKN
jgi:hypothetical protein